MWLNTQGEQCWGWGPIWQVITPLHKHFSWTPPLWLGVKINREAEALKLFLDRSNSFMIPWYNIKIWTGTTQPCLKASLTFSSFYGFYCIRTLEECSAHRVWHQMRQKQQMSELDYLRCCVQHSSGVKWFVFGWKWYSTSPQFLFMLLYRGGLWKLRWPASVDTTCDWARPFHHISSMCFSYLLKNFLFPSFILLTFKPN